MQHGPDIARSAALIGNPARANILTALMSGKALTATELAQEAGVTVQTCSSHLQKLQDGGLLRVRKEGRHKYFVLAHADVAQVLEGLMGLAAGAGHLRTRTGPKDPALRHARVCYNHLAGHLGTQMYDAMLVRGDLLLCGDALTLSQQGAAFAETLAIDLAPLQRASAPMCRECLDWSERKSHLAGSLGRAFLSRFLDLGWARRDADTRAIHFSASGQRAFDDAFVQGSAG